MVKFSFRGIYYGKSEAITRARKINPKKYRVKVVPETRGYFSVLTRKKR